MQTIWAERALVGEHWLKRLRVDIADGRIAGLEVDTDPIGHLVGCLVPAPANAHSHAFQRAMAGLTEAKNGVSGDSFWSWRQMMYRFLDRLTPEDVQAIAAFVQMEMLEAGFGASVEFHYLHHQRDGAPYDNPAEMSERIAAAAGISGIGLTLLPVHYRFGGCDRRPLTAGQVRFGNSPDRFARLHEAARRAVGSLPADARIGVAPHSLRAVAPEELPEIVALASGGPVHMHLAEQQAEVAEVEEHLGARPVAWALDNIEMDQRWCLIHCTQMEREETVGLAATGAVAGLCPLTEASLGDGIFDGVTWLTSNGAIAIGSDSNIRISLSEELRQLETSQRLRDHSRAALATSARPTGRRLFEDTARGGAQASGRGSGRIEPGGWADLLALDTSNPDLAGLTGDTALDTFVMAGDNRMVRDVWSAGRHLVKEGRHIAADEIRAAYARTVAALRDGL